MDFAHPPLKIPAFAFICDQGKRAAVALGRFLLGTEPAQQVRSRGVQQMEIIELGCLRQLIDDLQTRAWAVRHGARQSQPFDDVEVSKNFPAGWLDVASVAKAG